jgi:hypothetical protein
VSNSASASSITTSAISHTAGNTLCVCVHQTDLIHLVTSVSNTAGDKFILVGDATRNGVNHLYMYIARNIIGNASDVITVTFSGTSTSNALFSNEYSGVAHTLPVDGWQTTRTSSSNALGFTVSTSYAANAIVACFGNDGTVNTSITAAAGFTLENSDTNNFSGIIDKVSSTIQSSVNAGVTYNSSTHISGMEVTLAGSSQNPAISYVESVTIDHTKVGTVNNTNQSNFPLLDSGTDAKLATVANSGHIQNTGASNGVTIPADLFYSTNSRCANMLDTTGLDFEPESYTATSGNWIAWVSVPSASHSANTVIYRCYGSSAVKNSPSLGTAVWANEGNFVSVFHFSSMQGTCLGGAATPLPVQDSTSNADHLCGQSNGNQFPVNSAAQIAKGMDFTGTINTGLDFQTNGSGLIVGANLPTGSHVWTIEAWEKIPSGMAVGLAFGWGKNSVTGDRASLFWNHDTNNYVECDSCNFGAPFTADNAWHYFSGVNTATRNVDGLFYQDGAVQTTTAGGGTVTFAIVATDMSIGVVPTLTNVDLFAGTLDEARISNVARSADWIVTTYNCGGKTCTTIGAEGSPGGIRHRAIQD